MNEPIEVTILSSDPILAWAIQARVRDSGLSAHSHTEAEPGAAESAGREPAVVVLAPQTWQELGRWLPGVRRRFGASRWLLRSRLRVAGMYLSSLHHPPHCGIMGSQATPAEFQAQLRALVAGAPSCPPPRLLAHINTALCAIPDHEQAIALVEEELECACAVSLGLSNLRIAAALNLSLGETKNTLTAVYRKLGVQRRAALGELLERAVFPASESF